MNITFKNILYRSLGYLPVIICYALLSFTPSLSSFTFWNGSVQLALFITVVSIPAYLTKRMSFVDIGWPWGLVCIGLLMCFFGKGYWLRTYLVAVMYLFSGLRMGIGALVLLKKGYLNTELSRYKFQRKR